MKPINIIMYPARAAALALAFGAQNQPPAPRAIGNAVAEFKTSFTRIATVRELRDGRLLVVDEHERGLSLVDFKSGVLREVGRTGDGPGEYGVPGRIVALPGDSSLLHDPRNARYLTIKPDGTPGEIFQIDDTIQRTLGARATVPRATDARGNIYFEGLQITGGRTGAPVPRDSAPIFRYDRRTRKLDTVAWVQLAKRNVRVTPGQDPGGVSISVGAQAFPARDDWAVLPDGGVAIVRVRDYHVDWYSPTGTRNSGPSVRFSAIAVTDAEKAAWRAERKSRAVPRASGTVLPNMPEPEWPPALPPFKYWETFSRPNGELWVLRSHRSGENPVYDVFRAPGTPAERIILPARTRLVGFGNGTAYLVRRDQDDLEYLQLYRLP